MIRQEIEIINKKGLHGRASEKLINVASKFVSDIWVEHINPRNKHLRAHAKSIIGVLSLAASQGRTITIEASGPDETEAVAAIAALINNKFNEDE